MFWLCSDIVILTWNPAMSVPKKYFDLMQEIMMTLLLLATPKEQFPMSKHKNIRYHQIHKMFIFITTSNAFWSKMIFHTNNGWSSTRFKAFLVESKQINIDGIWYSELDLSGNKIRETSRKHETGKQRKTWWYWFMHWFMFWFSR